MKPGHQLQIEERRAQVLRHFAEHPTDTFRQAAEALDIPKSTVERDFRAGTQAVVERAAHAYIGIIVNRNETIIGGLMPSAMMGRSIAAQTIVQLQDQILKIFGLYAPTKSEKTINLKFAAEQLAAELGLDPGDVLAEAERIIAGADTA